MITLEQETLAGPPTSGGRGPPLLIHCLLHGNVPRLQSIGPVVLPEDELTGTNIF